MKNTYKLLITFLLIGLIVSCGDDKKSTTEPENQDHDAALVGTWQLTAILAPIATTPDAIGLFLTAVFTADGTVSFTTVDTEGTSIDSGTWGTTNGVLTINLEGEDPASSPYSIDGNKATISAFPVAYQGTVINASLEFTKVL